MSFNKRAIAAAALAGSAFASPAPQQLNFNAIAAAPAVAQGPVVTNGVADQTASLYTSFVISGATSAVSTAAAGATPAPVLARDASPKQERGFTFSLGWGWPIPFTFPGFGNPPGYGSQPTSSSAPVAPGYGSQPTSSSAPVAPGYGGGKTTTSSKAPSPPKYATSTSARTSSSVPVATSAPVATPSSYTPYYPALATSYTTDPALTGTTTAGQACPTTPEQGTYCGFINPEDPCAPQPDGYGPVPTPDTASAFLAYPSLHAQASAAASVIPSVNNTQYTQVFKDLSGAVSASSYLGLFTLKTYSPAQCAAYCDGSSLCTAFNIFAERDPSLAPAANDTSAPTVWGTWCPNPPSMTSYKCTLWGSNIDASLATNAGQNREQFQIVITASNGYDKTNVTVPSKPTAPSYPSRPTASASASTKASAPAYPTKSSSPSPPSYPSNPSPPSYPSLPSFPWDIPQSLGGKAINAPSFWLGSQVFPGPFNPQVCSDYALAQTSANIQLGTNQVAAMFNAYFLYKNGHPWGTGCSLYNTNLGISWATYAGASFQGDVFSCKQSWSFSLTAEARASIGFF